MAVYIHQRVANPIAAQNGRIMHPANPIADPVHMAAPTGREGHNSIPENDDVHLCGRRHPEPLPTSRWPKGRGRCLEGDEVVVLEDINLLAGLANGNILGRQRMNGQGLCYDADLSLSGITNIDPPDRAPGVWTGFLVFLEDDILVPLGKERCP